jgi:hypothetical protein
MEIKKINLDRKPIETDYIRSKQDFQHVLANYKKGHIPVFKQPLFYGVIGFASLATLITVSLFNFNSPENDKITTSKTDLIENAPIKKISKDSKQVAMAKVIMASSTVEKSGPENKKSTIRSNNPIPESDNQVISEDVVIERKSKPSTSNIPHISGISDGSITISDFCSEKGILLRSEKEVVSFRLQYVSGGSDKMIVVSGNKIPDSVCAEMSKSSMEQLVFITDIEVRDEQGRVSVPSMNLWVSNKG